MQDIVNNINTWVWSYWLVGLALGAGLMFSILTRFMQVRHFREMLRLLFSSKASDQGISSFQALAVSLSGRVGTGNIAGVAAAIGFGGPGAVFWMWVVAFLGASTAYVEAALGQIYKEVDEGQYRGGPAFYIEKAMGQKWYGWLFAVTTIVATGLLLPTVQANAISTSAEIAFGTNGTFDTFLGSISVTKLSAATIIVTILGFIIFGGVKRIAHVTQVVVPFMALAYIITAIGIVAVNISELPRVFGLIPERRIYSNGRSRCSNRLGRQTWRLLERSGAGNGTTCGRGRRSPASRAAGTRAGVFGLHRYAFRLFGDRIHDPDHGCL